MFCLIDNIMSVTSHVSRETTIKLLNWSFQMKIRVFALVFALVFLFGCSEDPTVSSNNGVTIDYPDTLIDSLTYVAMGASDCVGEGAIPQTKGYVYLISDSLENFVNIVNFENLGEPGLEVDEIISSEVSSAISSDPDIITLWTGGNDFNAIMRDVIWYGLENADYSFFETHLDLLLDTLSSSLPTSDIFIANLPDLTVLPVYEEYDLSNEVIAMAEQLVVDMNGVIEEHAAKYGCILVDLYSNRFFVSNESNISDDGFHPSNSGYKIMADEFLKEIVQQF